MNSCILSRLVSDAAENLESAEATRKRLPHHNQPRHTPRGTRRPSRSTQTARHTTATVRFPLTSFRPFLTLFSKYFASFPHGTCSLSVSHPYLALDGIYHPLELQSQATRLVEDAPYDSDRGTNGTVTLAGTFFQRISPRTSSGVASLDYNSRTTFLIHNLGCSRFSRPY